MPSYKHGRAARPGNVVLERDLTATPIPPVDADWIRAAYTPEQARTSEQKEVLSVSDSLVAELEQANEYVIGVPMHNFGVPAVFKLWIDQIARVQRTFVMENGDLKGLLCGKQATFIVAMGGNYGMHSERASLNFVEPYLEATFRFIGVANSIFFTVTGTGALRNGGSREAFLAPHLEAVRAHAQLSAGVVP